MEKTIDVKQNEERFYVELEGETAIISYEMLSPEVIDFQHTVVPEKFRGQGIAEAMAAKALDYSKEKKFKVRASCRFISSYIKRNTQYQDLLEGN